MEVCRLCLNTGSSLALHFIFGDGSDTLLKILTCLPLRISEADNLPDKICDSCFRKVNEFYCFRSTAVESENRLCDSQNTKDAQGRISNENGEELDFKSSKWIFNNNSSNVPLKLEPFTPLTLKTYISVQTQTDDLSDFLKLIDIKEEIIDDTTLEENLYDGISFKNEDLIENKDDVLDNSQSDQFDYCDASDFLPSSITNKIDIYKKVKSPKKSKTHNRKNSHGTLSFIDKDASNSKSVNNLYSKDVWVCCVCFKKYKNKEWILKHYKTHGMITKNETNSSSTLEKKPYKCSLCEKVFKTPLEILKHGKNAHSYSNTYLYEDAKNDLVTAVPKPATKRFICDLCDEKFVYMKYLKAHRSAAHPESCENRLVHRCMYCKNEFNHLNSLRRHLRNHTGEKNYLCSVCGKALSSKEHLNFHMRIHTGYKPNVCKTCGKGFVKKCNLKLHERVHSGERPHVCCHCGKAFSQRSTLVIHERYHSGARPYVCELCNKGFVAKGLLSMHLKSSCV